MEQDRISCTQLMILLWTALMAPAAELLPGSVLPMAGQGAWLSALAALPIALGCGWVLYRLGRPGLSRGLLEILGPILGKGVLLLYIMWGEFLLALRLRLCAQRLLSSGERDGSLWFFLPVCALLALWMGRGKLSAFARAGQVFLAALLAAAAVVLSLSLFQVRQENLFPLWVEDVPGILLGALPVSGVLGYGVFAAFLLRDVQQGQGLGRRWTGWTVAGCLLLGAEQLIVVGSFGPKLAQRLTSPFFTLAKSVGVEGAFQRVESVIGALWTFSDLTLAVLLLMALGRVVQSVFPKVGEKAAVTGALLPGAVAGLAAFSTRFPAREWGSDAALWGNLIFALVIPCGTLAVGWCRKRI